MADIQKWSCLDRPSAKRIALPKPRRQQTTDPGTKKGWAKIRNLTKTQPFVKRTALDDAMCSINNPCVTSPRTNDRRLMASPGTRVQVKREAEAEHVSTVNQQRPTRAKHHRAHAWKEIGRALFRRCHIDTNRAPSPAPVGSLACCVTPKRICQSPGGKCLPVVKGRPGRCACVSSTTAPKRNACRGAADEAYPPKRLRTGHIRRAIRTRERVVVLPEAQK